MKPLGALGKTILLNIGIVLVYDLLIIAMNRGSSSNSEAELGVALFLMMVIALHVFILLAAGLGYIIAKKSDVGKALLLSAVIVLLVGFASCVGSLSLMG